MLGRLEVEKSYELRSTVGLRELGLYEKVGYL
jgi:hypothetical protein